MISKSLIMAVLMSLTFGISWAANVELGKKYLKEGKYSEALRIFYALEKAGDQEAIFQLGVIFNLGKGVNINYTEAAKFYTAAANKGHLKARYNLGVLYYYGQGVEKNYDMALKLIEIPAQRGLGAAQYGLGLMYYEGNGVAKNYSTAMHWFGLALKNDEASAANTIGEMYEFGRGVNIDYRKAFEYYKLGAEKGNSKAQHNLGNFYLYGKGVSANIGESLRWHKLASAQGNTNSQVLIDVLINQGAQNSNSQIEPRISRSERFPLIDPSKTSYEIEYSFNDEIFIINGEVFDAKTYCYNMNKGNKVVFVDGSPFGSCVSAKIINLDTSERCEAWCQ